MKTIISVVVALVVCSLSSCVKEEPSPDGGYTYRSVTLGGKNNSGNTGKGTRHIMSIDTDSIES